MTIGHTSKLVLVIRRICGPKKKNDCNANSRQKIPRHDIENDHYQASIVSEEVGLQSNFGCKQRANPSFSNFPVYLLLKDPRKQYA